MNKVIFIIGPTSSGKSAVAVRLAKEINGDVISCDSMQVYKGMDIITQAPGDDVLSRVKYHLVGSVPPEEEFSAAQFAEKAEKIIGSVLAEGRIPIVAGGTGLYVKALVDGLFPAPPKDEDLRKRLREIASEKGKGYLHQKLKEVDPDTAERLHPNDIRRIVRAIEVYRLTGKTIHEKKGESGGILSKYDCLMFGLDLPRRTLYERIEATVDRMFEQGLVDEVKKLRRRTLSLTAEKALGVKEVSAFLDGKAELEGVRDELKKNTRKYAKRQLTWFRADKRIEWIDAGRSVDEIVENILKKLKNSDPSLLNR
ncbi:MAG: tRNA (adenosine(37)-N6)-dimethylallyltransferase MiaA [Candidatus Omnitrophota bacterium]|nr:tRNA (adenosine(37)-N6)-dimethylallyltransferase MiaA [Candidatus Omnitrophota bacterium]